MYLYDTNVLSELRKPKVDESLLKFHKTVKRSKQQIYISSITVGEVVKSIAKLQRKNDVQQALILRKWLDNDIRFLVDNSIPFDTECARVWGELMAINPHNEIDKQLVATALVHDLVLVTRNVKDIEKTGVRFVNPFG